VASAHSSSTAGLVAVRHLLAVAAACCLAIVIFLVVDIDHRVEGYRTATTSGTRGLATLTRCEWRRTGSFCVGDFASADNRIRRPGIRINGAAEILNWGAANGSGPPPPATKVRAAVAGPEADEAWALDGGPWLNFSLLHAVVLLPLALAVAALRRVFRGGLSGWRTRRVRHQRRRLRRDRRRLRHDQDRVRKGHTG
jgi:hypothetical protein